MGSNYFWVQFSNSVVELKGDLHQQVGVISDLLSWLSVAKFGIGLPLHFNPIQLPCVAVQLRDLKLSLDIFGSVKPLLSDQPDNFYQLHTSVLRK